MRCRFVKAAEWEIDDAIEYYESQQSGLGAELLKEVRSAIERIEQHPEAWHPVSQRTRRCQLHRFPYGVLYQIRQDELLIVAVAHLHRKPERWRDRI